MPPHTYTDTLGDLPDAEEDYRESSDEDFNPTAAPADDSPSDSEEDDIALPIPKNRKRAPPVPDELDSGDEITIEAARKRKAKKRKTGKGGDDVELLLSDDGEGGLVKTRAQRRVELKERRPLARTEGATIDVNALWAQMSAAPLRPVYPSSTEVADPNAAKRQDVDMGMHEAPPPVDEEANLVRVKKLYTFAGQVTTEEKEIPRSSLAKYVSDGWRAVEPAVQESSDAEDKPEATASSQPRIHRPLRRPSRFDANPTGFVRTLAPEHQLTWPRKTPLVQAAQTDMLPPELSKTRVEKAQKLNVVDKSRLDWTGFVHQEGIAEELDVHGKTKEAYLGRMQFLAGVEAKQEEDRKRLKTTAAA